MIYLYAIGTTGRRQKVGYSGDPETRLKKLQTGNPEPLLVHYAFPVDPTKARKLESYFHRQYNHRRVQGEWFDMSVDEVVGLMQHHEIMLETIQASL